MILKLLKQHEGIPNYSLKWRGNKIRLVNDYTGTIGVFVTGEKELTIPAKEAGDIKRRYERLH